MCLILRYKIDFFRLFATRSIQVTVLNQNIPSVTETFQSLYSRWESKQALGNRVTISFSTNVITCSIAHYYLRHLKNPISKFFTFSFSHRATKTQASCLDDVPVTVERYDFLKESQKPGEEYNAFEQCQQSFGPNFVPHVKPDEPPFEVKKIFFFLLLLLL